jgi:ketosteroid isomerase-like protein
MNEQQNVDVVRKGYEAFGRGDIPGLLAQLDENVSWVTPGPPDLPTAGKRRGHQAVKDFFQKLASIGDIQRFETKDFIAQGDRVVVLGEGTDRIKATGKAVDFRFAHTFTVRNGKVVAFEEYSDMTATVQEIRAAQARV